MDIGYSDAMPISVSDLFQKAGLRHEGTVRWGQQVPTEHAGIYCVSSSESPKAAAVAFRRIHVSESAFDELLAARPFLTVCDKPATLSSLEEHLSSYWLPTEPLLYVGMAGTSLRHRVSQYYKTRLGARSPHAGGWWLKMLEDLKDLHLHYALSLEPRRHEKVILQEFNAALNRQQQSEVNITHTLGPFANIDLPGIGRKAHRLQNYITDPTTPRSPPAPPVTKEVRTPPTATLPTPSTTANLIDGNYEVVVSSQPVTERDRTSSNLRIPASAKFAFPVHPSHVTVVIDDLPLNARWRPNGSRSGTLGLGVDVMRSLSERNERARIGVSERTYYLLRK